MNKLINLLATISLVFLLSCTSSGAQLFMENPQFLKRTTTVLGLNVSELREVLGKPGQIKQNKCAAPIQASVSGQLTTVPGDTWLYFNRTPTTRTTLEVCVVKGYAVGEHRIVGIVKGSRIYVSDTALFDTNLIKKAHKGELGDVPRKERIMPHSYPDKEYEL